MSSYTFVGELPRHLYCFVDASFLYKDKTGFIPCVWYAVSSHPSRVWGCTVHLENGAIYRNLPPHALSFSDNPKATEWSVYQSQAWDCYGYSFSTIEYRYLKGLNCKTLINDKVYDGIYLFSIAPIGDGYSEYPEQAKEFKVIQLTNDRVTLQPTNHLIVEDLSFTGKLEGLPSGLKRLTETWSCED